MSKADSVFSNELLRERQKLPDLVDNAAKFSIFHQHKITVLGTIVELPYDLRIQSAVSNGIGATDPGRADSLIDLIRRLRLTNEVRILIRFIERGEQSGGFCFRSAAPQTVAAPSSGRIWIDMMTGELPGCIERSTHIERKA